MLFSASNNTEPPLCLTDHLVHTYRLITRYHLLLPIQPGSCIIGHLCTFFCLLLFTEASQHESSCQEALNWRRMNSSPVSHLCCFCFLIFLKIRLSDSVHLLRGRLCFVLHVSGLLNVFKNTLHSLLRFTNTEALRINLLVQKYYNMPVRLLSVAGFIESTKQQQLF